MDYYAKLRKNTCCPLPIFGRLFTSTVGFSSTHVSPLLVKSITELAAFNQCRVLTAIFPRQVSMLESSQVLLRRRLRENLANGSSIQQTIILLIQ